MSVMGLEISKAAPGYRGRRFAAFLIDTTVILGLLYVIFRLTGKPDFPGVKVAMDSVKAEAAGPNYQELTNEMFTLFNTAFAQTLIIWFIYEVLAQAVFSGATIGKLAMKLKISAVNPNQGWFSKFIFMTVRSAIKFIFLYIFQGFPFLIAILTMFTNKQSRTGYDIFVKTYVKDLKEEQTKEFLAVT